MKIRPSRSSILVFGVSFFIGIWLWLMLGSTAITPVQSGIPPNESRVLVITRFFSTRDPNYLPPATLTAYYALVEQGLSSAATSTSARATMSAVQTAQPTLGPLLGPWQLRSKSEKIGFFLPLGWLITVGADDGSVVEVRKDVVVLTPQPLEGLPTSRDSMMITIFTGDNIVQNLGRPVLANSRQQSALEIIEQSRLALTGTNAFDISAITESRELPFRCWSYTFRSSYSAVPDGVLMITFACEIGHGQVFLATLEPANSHAYSEAIQILSSMRTLP